MWRQQWTLRRKLGLMALIFVLSLVGNVVLSAGTMWAYFKPAFSKAETAVLAQQQIERLRATYRGLRETVEAAPASGQDQHRRRLQDALEGLLPTAQDVLQNLRLGALAEALVQQHQALKDHLESLPSATGEPGAQTYGDFLKIDELLSQVTAALAEQRQEHIDHASNMQWLIVCLLIANTTVGGLLCLLGLWFVRRWVAKPAAELRAATRRISEGDYDVHLDLPSEDELGRLGREVNQMAARIAELQDQLVDRERRSAAGDMVERLQQHLNETLGEIQAVAQQSVHGRQPTGEIAVCQQRIVETVDRFRVWLHDLRESVNPNRSELRPVDVESIIQAVAVVLRPTLERSQVTLQTQVTGDLKRVRLDPLKIEQMLLALATNAVEVSKPGQTVTLRAAMREPATEGWDLVVSDQGPGIPAELRDKVFIPFFTTKPDGNGVGLAMASGVVRLHGGRLSVASEPNQGSTFTAHFPPETLRPSADSSAAGNATTANRSVP